MLERKVSLKHQSSLYADTAYQLDLLTQPKVPAFNDKLETYGLAPLKSTGVDILQINVGKMCNQVCKHCHVDAGPDRKEIMTRETMNLCLNAIKDAGIQTVDLTGGAPEMNPHFEWFVTEIKELGSHVMVRCNLTIITSHTKYHHLPEFYKKHGIEVVSSLPHFSAKRTNAQRGQGVFEKSIEALKMLNDVGYGKKNSDLKLNLVYNPSGAFLPGDQAGLESDFKKRLKMDFDVEFNSLFAITNMPVSRFLDYLHSSGNYESYMEELVNAFNPGAALGVMCRNTLSVSWDGLLYDCDFNQMLDLPVEPGQHRHIRSFDFELLKTRKIVTNQHCYGCTAGSGSSCGGATA